jgi:hypothetical protein
VILTHLVFFQFLGGASPAGTLPPVVVPAVQQGGGYYRKPKHWLKARREQEEERQREFDAVFDALNPVKREAKQIFKVKPLAIELPDTSHYEIEAFLERQEQLTKKRRNAEESELMEILQFLR